MRQRFVVCLLLLFCLSAAVRGQAALSSPLSSQIDLLVKNMLPPGSDAGIAVYDLTNQKTLYAYRADKLCRPASTMKLLTGITALSGPGADEPFRTEVWYKGTIEHDVLHGDLYVKGGFDPEFDDASMDSLISRVLTFPFSSVQGNIYGDVSMKDSLHWGNGWAWDDNPGAYQPYLSPLIYNKGTVKVTAVAANERGQAATLQCMPESTFYTVRNETRSRTAEAGKFTVSRNWLENGNTLVVSGNVEGTQTGEVNLYTARDFFMHTFTERLRRKGIHIRDAYAYADFVPDSTAVQMAIWECPVQAVLDQVMKESENLGAEALLCRMAAQHTRKKKVSAKDGVDVINKLIKQLGQSPDAYKIVDGSGMSNYNYLSPALLVDFLKYAHSNTDLFRKLYKALPIAGVDGTLEYRMKSGRVYKNVTAKTGSFTGICNLAGYLRTSDNRLLAFAVMNQNVLSLPAARLFQDELCRILSR